jgi:hypothetical protein
MNAQPSFQPQEHSPQRRVSRSLRQPRTLHRNPVVTTKIHASRRKRSRLKASAVYAHRRQGLEAATKLVTYSALSVFGIVTLVNSIGYNYSQQSKLQHLKTESQDAKLRVEKINSNFNRSFDPHAQANVMQENSYKTAPDRRQIVLLIPRVQSPSRVIGKN